jgi:hypothetical protein
MRGERQESLSWHLGRLSKKQTLLREEMRNENENHRRKYNGGSINFGRKVQ